MPIREEATIPLVWAITGRWRGWLDQPPIDALLQLH